jgi:pectate lyase
VLEGVNPELIEAGDGISLDGTDGLWVDHVTFHAISDGFIDATQRAGHLTFSWLKNDGDNPAACTGRHPRSNELSRTTATIHHTLWQHVDGRAPLVTHGGSRVHLYDNVVLDDVDYAVGAACGAEVRLERTTFQNVATPTLKATCSDDGTLGSIAARDGKNVYGAGVGSHRSDGAAASEPNDAVFSVPYAYELEPAESARTKVLARAGAGGPWALAWGNP